MAIMYKAIEASALDVVTVFLDGKHVGRIQRERIHAGGFYYQPKGTLQKDRGEVFPTLDACKRSLEDDTSMDDLVPCPQCDGIVGNCNGYCDETGEVTRASANEWHKQND